MENLLERIRRAELDSILDLFPPGARVLEIGGGAGFQAALLAGHGCLVQSIDVASRPDPARQRYSRQHFPVSTYDGRSLPFPSSSFDIVYSSHALYHAVPLQPMLAEIARVLVPGGVAIHVLPSASWRFWTALVHYPHLSVKAFQRLCGRRIPAPSVASAAAPTAKKKRSRLRAVLIPAPLGFGSNVFAEWIGFRQSSWRRVFLAAGYRVVSSRRGPLFYTGFLMAPRLPISLRRLFAHLLGPACFVWTMSAPSVSRNR